MLSTAEIPFRAVAFGFEIVKVKLVLPFHRMLDAPNDFVMVGGPTTVSEAVAGTPGPPLSEVTVTVLF